MTYRLYGGTNGGSDGVANHLCKNGVCVYEKYRGMGMKECGRMEYGGKRALFLASK